MTKQPAQSQVSKQLKEVLLLFSIPIGIIIVLIAFLYIPRLLANPSYDFIYCEGYHCNGKFSVGSNGNLQVAPEENDRFSSYQSDASLFYYDVQRDATRPLQDDEATRYQLDASSKSPDGYKLERTSSGGGILFWGGHSSGWSLGKGIVSKPITLNTGYGDYKFIGWVLP